MSRALTLVFGRIRIPINEDRAESELILDHPNRYNGEGIQHIAGGSENIYEPTDQISANGVRFRPPPTAIMISATGGSTVIVSLWTGCRQTAS